MTVDFGRLEKCLVGSGIFTHIQAASVCAHLENTARYVEEVSALFLQGEFGVALRRIREEAGDSIPLPREQG